MPNTIVPANGEAMPKAKFNLSEIMKAAWKRYRFVRANYSAWQIERGIIDGSFANALRIGWRLAKEAAAKAEKAIGLASGPNAVRAEAIQREIDSLTFKTLRYDTVAMRRRLETELAALAA